MRVEVSAKAERYLERQARELSRGLGRAVRPTEVLELLIELAILDEDRYEPDSGAVLSTIRRSAEQPERDSSRAGEPAGRFAPQLLLRHLKGED